MATQDGSAPRSERVRVLLIDDSPDILLLVAAFLRATEFELSTAENAEDALARIVTDRYDVVLLDIQLPGMDGLSAARAIRALEHTQDRSPCTLIAMSGNASPADRAASLNAGCDRHLSKPVGKRALLGILRS